MKNLPKIDIDCSKLFASIYAPIRLKLLLAAIELKVFNELSKPISAEAVAQACFALGSSPFVHAPWSHPWARWNSTLDGRQRKSEIRGQKSEVRGRRSEVGGQRSEVRGRRVS